MHILFFFRKEYKNRTFAVVNLAVAILLAAVFFLQVVLNFAVGNIHLGETWKLLTLYYTIPGTIQVLTSLALYLKRNSRLAIIAYAAPIIAALVEILFNARIPYIVEFYFTIINYIYLTFYGWKKLLPIVYFLFFSLEAVVYLNSLTSFEYLFLILGLLFLITMSTISGTLANAVINSLLIQSFMEENVKNLTPEKFKEHLLSVLPYIGVNFIEVKTRRDELTVSIGRPQRDIQVYRVGDSTVRIGKPASWVSREFVLSFAVNAVTSVLLSLEEELRQKEQLKQFIMGFTRAVELRDPYTRGHAENVAYYAFEIGKSLGLDKSKMELLKTASLLHDVGKIVIPDKILLKPMQLNDEEFEIIKLHSTVGYLLLKDIEGMGEVAKVVKHHHERWDGRGYPDGLSGVEIPYLSRLITVADVFDALTTERPYRSAFSREEALEIMERKEVAFDPQVFAVAKEVLREIPLASFPSVQFPESECLDRIRKILSWDNITVDCPFPEKLRILIVNVKEIEEMDFANFMIRAVRELKKSGRSIWFQMVRMSKGKFLIVSDDRTGDYLFNQFKEFPVSIQDLL